MARESIAHRLDIAQAERVLLALIPEARTVPAIGRLIATVATSAGAVAPDSWELTLRLKDLCLNVGQVAVLTVRDNEVFLCCAPLQRRPARLQRYWARKGESLYAAVRAPSVGLWMAHGRTVDLEPEIVRGLRQFARAAAAAKTKSPWKTAHSPAAVEFFGESIGRQIDQPGYWIGPGVEDEAAVSPAELERDLDSIREVEKAAVEHVTQRYHEAGWVVDSREAEKVGYDLRCSRGGVVRHVEVKGRSGDGHTIILTSGEWKRAREDAKWWLAIVRRAGSAHEALTEYAGRDIPANFTVDPIAFRLTRGSQDESA